MSPPPPPLIASALPDWNVLISNESSPPPALPDHVVDATSERYRALFRRLTGYTLDEFPMHDPGAEPDED